MNFNKLIILLVLTFVSTSVFAQDPREKSHSMNVVPFFGEGMQRYYISWSSSSGSNDGWQHDIYNQIISFTSDGNINFDTEAQRYIGTGYDEAQEPVNVAINPTDNTMLSVWEDGSGSTVDIRGQMHKPDGTVIKSNWIISGGEESQHSPNAVHLNGMFIVSLTDEAPPAQTSMNEVRILNDQTGEEIGSLELSPREEDNWWAVSASNDKNFALIVWGNGESLYGSVIKLSVDTVVKTDQRFYISNIDQYYYSISWLEEISKFIVIAKVWNNSAACLIDTNGVRSSFTSIPNAPITRETGLAVRWNESESEYQIIFTSGQQDLTSLSVTESSVSLIQINKQIIDSNWQTTGISCQFVKTINGNDIWESDRKILIAHNDENSNNAVYHFLTVEDLTSVSKEDVEQIPNQFTLYPAYPNPFNPSVTINYSVASAMDIQIKIFNLRGELITTLINDFKSTGKYSIAWKGIDSNNNHVSSGVYFVRLTAGEFTQSQKIIFQK